MAKRKQLILPARYIRVNSNIAGNFAIRGKGGRFLGRTKGKEGSAGDRTKIRTVTQDIDIDKDGRTDFYGGTLLGRTPRIQVKASKRARGYVREI